MRDTNPIVLRRLLALRQFPLFADAELGELVSLAENVQEAVLPRHAVIAEGRLAIIQLVVDGRIETVRGLRTSAAWESREVFGVLEVLAGRELRTQAVAALDTHTLQLGAADFVDVLEDNFGLLLSVLRRLASRVASTTPEPEPGVGVVPRAADGQLGLVERLIALRMHPSFATARLEALSILAHVATEEVWPAGRVVARAGEPAQGAFTVIEGTLVARGAARTHRLGAGAAVGVVESVARTPHRSTLEASSPVRVLHTTSRALLDVIEDHTDLGLSMISTFAAALIDGVPGVVSADAAQEMRDPVPAAQALHPPRREMAR